MSDSLPILVLVGRNSLAMLLVYALEREIRVSQNGGIKVKIIARLLHARVTNAIVDRTFNTCRRDNFKPVNSISRKRYGVKRINDDRRNRDNMHRRIIFTRVIPWEQVFE